MMTRNAMRPVVLCLQHESSAPPAGGGSGTSAASPRVGRAGASPRTAGASPRGSSAAAGQQFGASPFMPIAAAGGLLLPLCSLIFVPTHRTSPNSRSACDSAVFVHIQSFLRRCLPGVLGHMCRLQEFQDSASPQCPPCQGCSTAETGCMLPPLQRQRRRRPAPAPRTCAPAASRRTRSSSTTAWPAARRTAWTCRSGTGARWATLDAAP